MFELTPAEWEVIQLSLKVAFWSVVCSLPLAVAIAVLLARCKFPGKSLFDAVVHLPLVLPPVVIGYFLLLLLGRRGPLGALLDEYLGIVVAFRWTGAAIAAAIWHRRIRQTFIPYGAVIAAGTLLSLPVIH